MKIAPTVLVLVNVQSKAVSAYLSIVMQDDLSDKE